jgi:tetratricopeptide (TPR) repeat protein
VAQANHERTFARGLAALRNGDPLEALAYFEASLKLEAESPNPARRVRYASYFGYCIASVLGKKRDGLRICRKAATSEFFTPDILLNLARVQLLMGDRKEAWSTLMRGLRLDPEHPGLIAEVRQMGIRRKPVIPFLDRSHPLNRLAGSLSSRGGPAQKK